ncbi:MAG: sialate O-acetylesterase, partial [Granulosicoccus sp.]
MLKHFRLAHSLFAAAALFFSVGIAHAAGDPPDIPTNLQGSITGDQVTLTWSPSNNDDGIVGYNVYVNNTYADTVFETTYTGPVVEGELTDFFIIAFDTIPRRYSLRSEQLSLPTSLIPADLTIPPTAPTNLTGEIVDGQVTLNWTASTDDEAVRGYNVYRDNIYLDTVFDTSFTTANEADESHNWYVVAFDTRTNYSALSRTIRLPDTGPVDTTLPPSTPSGLQIEVTDTDNPSLFNARLTWQASTDNQAVRGYNIYADGKYVSTSFSTTYETQLPPESSYEVTVVAFDFDENYSTPSEVLTVQTPSIEFLPPSTPVGLSAEFIEDDGQNVVSLTWEPSTGSLPVRGYNVYRDDTYLTTAFTNSFIDTVPVTGSVSYSIFAFDESENYSGRSNKVNLLANINQPPFIASLEDQIITAGETLELVIAPTDVDGGVPGLMFSDLPEGAENIDNRDGTRSIVWTPTAGDVGEYTVVVTAFDSVDPAISTSQNLKITVIDGDIGEEPPFTLSIGDSPLNLIEGDAEGLTIPILVERREGFEAPINLSVETETAADADQLTTLLSVATLDVENPASVLSVQLAIGTLPLLPEQRRLVITAFSEDFNDQLSVTMAVTPVARDDVYLLIGQSNMVGASNLDAKRAGAGEPDEPNPRILQANITANNAELLSAETLTNNIFDLGVARFTPAEDPLHVPFDSTTGLKPGSQIGMGLSFAKAALPNTTRNIVLVPAAWSASSFCDADNLDAQWNPDPSDNTALGNTLLFDRALLRVNATLAESGGILRGILWHQGESDSNDTCAPLYEENMVKLAQALRTRILSDARGDAARGPDADIPFVVGTMSKGRTEDSDFSFFSPSKLLVDGVHRNISSLVSYSAVNNNDDLVPENGFPCGINACIHFGAAALREMGVRTYDSLLRAAMNEVDVVPPVSQPPAPP